MTKKRMEAELSTILEVTELNLKSWREKEKEVREAQCERDEWFAGYCLATCDQLRDFRDKLKKVLEK